MAIHISLIGQVFGRLTAIKRVNNTGQRKVTYLWLCECGKEKEIPAYRVTSGNTMSCGCLQKEIQQNQPRGRNSHSWKGGTTMSEGYRLIYRPEHANAKSNGYVREHVLVMSEYLDRPLTKGENVHHINGNRSDNRLCNLELWSTSQPSGQRVNDKVEWAKQILKKYSPHSLK